jgi:hypothetical protein
MYRKLVSLKREILHNLPHTSIFLLRTRRTSLLTFQNFLGEEKLKQRGETFENTGIFLPL